MVKDEGQYSVWRAQRRTSVIVNENTSWGNLTRVRFDLNKGDDLRLKIGEQGLTCL